MPSINLVTTKCQYFVAKPDNSVMALHNIKQHAKIMHLLLLPPRKPNGIPVMVYTSMNTGPAKI